MKSSLMLCMVTLGQLLMGCSTNLTHSLKAAQIAAPTRVAYHLPEDHRLHKDRKYQTDHAAEWLYFTGIVNSTHDNSLYGYELNIFQNYSEKQGFYYRLDIAISDVKGKKLWFDKIDLVTHDTLSFDTTRKENVWEYKADGILLRHFESSDVWELNAKSRGKSQFAIAVTLDNSGGDYTPESPQGIVSMGDCAQGTQQDMEGLSYYYSHPRMMTQGTFSLGSTTVPVSGKTWFDHQWGNFASCPANWNWFSLRFNDGSAAMLFGLNKAVQERVPLTDKWFSAFFSPAGKATYGLGANAFSLKPVRWFRSNTGREIPVDWIIETPQGVFGVKPVFDDQDLGDYYEGIVEVRKGSLDGPVIGYGYQEH